MQGFLKDKYLFCNYFVAAVRRRTFIIHLTFSTSVKLHPHGYVSVPSPRMNPDDVCLDPGIKPVLDYTVLISVSCEILKDVFYK